VIRQVKGKRAINRDKKGTHMANDTMIEADKLLRELLYLKSISVYKIVFYGSYARSQDSGESDLDVLIVSEDFNDKDIFSRIDASADIHRKLVERFLIPIDIMYLSLAEWNEEIHQSYMPLSGKVYQFNK